MSMDNDTRGWILTGISGLACVFGASFICIDLVVRLFPGKKHFKLQDSNGFLSCSLSLSSGVMLFSSLYKLLPESKEYLARGGYSPKAAAWVLIASFLAGVWGIQILSRVMHMFLPSHAVGCDHTHDDDAENQKNGREDDPNNSAMRETTPLLSQTAGDGHNHLRQERVNSQASSEGREQVLERSSTHRPSIPHRMTRKMTLLITGEKPSCDEDGHCRGYTSPCGVECFKNLNARGGMRLPQSFIGRPNLRRSASTSVKTSSPLSDTPRRSFANGSNLSPILQQPELAHEHPLHPSHPSHPSHLSTQISASRDSSRAASVSENSPSWQTDENSAEPHAHHHHVPQNAFLSLSFQTSVALVIHKLPEGFITYASNHANPNLGFNIFMALAIHNVTEGFCLALPIYLATTSRFRALMYSFVLGGFSQPLGAAIAALWLKLSEQGKGAYAPSEGVYGGLFAATSGILANVALNLLSESFELSHSRALCMFFVFLGMGILGVSSALTA